MKLISINHLIINDLVRFNLFHFADLFADTVSKEVFTNGGLRILRCTKVVHD